VAVKLLLQLVRDFQYSHLNFHLINLHYYPKKAAVVKMLSQLAQEMYSLQWIFCRDYQCLLNRR